MTYGSAGSVDVAVRAAGGGRVSIGANWYLDPTGRHQERFWDGQRWTQQVRDGRDEAVDPLVGGGEKVELPALQPHERPTAAREVPAADASARSPGGRSRPDHVHLSAVDEQRHRSLRFGSDEPLDTGPARYAHAKIEAAAVVGLVALLLATLPLLALVGFGGGLVAVGLALSGRRELIDLGDFDQSGGVRNALVGVLASLIAVVLVAVSAVAVARGGLVTLAACMIDSGGVACVTEFVMDVYGLLSVRP